jgi:hypothetical protein
MTGCPVETRHYKRGCQTSFYFFTTNALAEKFPIKKLDVYWIVEKVNMDKRSHASHK